MLTPPDGWTWEDAVKFSAAVVRRVAVTHAERGEAEWLANGAAFRAVRRWRDGDFRAYLARASRSALFEFRRSRRDDDRLDDVADVLATHGDAVVMSDMAEAVGPDLWPIAQAYASGMSQGDVSREFACGGIHRAAAAFKEIRARLSPFTGDAA